MQYGRSAMQFRDLHNIAYGVRRAYLLVCLLIIVHFVAEPSFSTSPQAVFCAIVRECIDVRGSIRRLSKFIATLI